MTVRPYGLDEGVALDGNAVDDSRADQPNVWSNLASAGGKIDRWTLGLSLLGDLDGSTKGECGKSECEDDE